jgi:hypothetical protein
VPEVRLSAAHAAALALALAALTAFAVGLGGCGGGGAKVPQGNPDLRDGAMAVDTYAQVEFLRGLLIASSDSYVAGGSAGDARPQLHRARSAYEQLAGRARAADPVLAREVAARFDLIAATLRSGAPPPRYAGLTGPLQDQLMDGVSQALVPPAARADPGLRAEALRRVVLRLAADYDAATSAPDSTDGQLAFEEAWGLWRRAQALVALVKPSLGPETGRVANTVNQLRGPAFPDGPLAPDQPPVAKVDAAATRVVTALDKRYGLVD